jgi:hypothetical protein
MTTTSANASLNGTMVSGRKALKATSVKPSTKPPATAP